MRSTSPVPAGQTKTILPVSMACRMSYVDRLDPRNALIALLDDRRSMMLVTTGTASLL